ncbi:WhiB family transcriptional regulator [Streptomyces chumphonensis]|uniref:Transcriptional regulator WhiB n=1 Tax=Streptomyces chumphonensis TaxID=1214925 RepID=A0A927IFV7_9ACTN|nr:WhiB family transcriptional regulator [Streptomyces chumphonensis]MBD3934846.1 WhiB family transcriptional regulator [Streptomyces chumphonensis]
MPSSHLIPTPHSPTTTSAAAQDWRHRAACREEDPELFFPVGNTGPALLQIEEAKRVCRSCPVQEQCLLCALETRQDYGVWGGASEDERRAMKRRAARQRVRKATTRTA